MAIIISGEVLGLTISGLSRAMHIGKGVIRILNHPEYL